MEIPLPQFCPIFGDWGDLEVPLLVQMSLIKCTWNLQNAMAAAFTVSELLGENQQGAKISPHSRLSVLSVLFAGFSVKVRSHPFSGT